MADPSLIGQSDAKRSDAVHQVTKFLLTPEGRALLHSNRYYEARKHLIPAFHEESISDVLRRAQHYPRPVVLAVYFPDRQGAARFSMVELRKAQGQANEPEPMPVNAQVSVGMFVDSLKAGSSIKFQHGWSESLARPFDPPALTSVTGAPHSKGVTKPFRRH